jgi:hypothetical protein
MGSVGDEVRKFMGVQRVVQSDALVESAKQERSYDAVIYAFGDQGSAQTALTKLKTALDKGDAHASADVDYSGNVLKRGDPLLTGLKGGASLNGEWFIYFRAPAEIEKIVRQSVETDPGIKILKQDPKSALVASKKRAPANVVEALNADPAAFLASLKPKQRVKLSEALAQIASADPAQRTAARKAVAALAK